MARAIKSAMTIGGATASDRGPAKRAPAAVDEPVLHDADPSFSVVTPCLNAADTLEATLESVAAQGYPLVEHVVVDGGSTDGTLDILRASGVRWISEPDDGLSDAVNKGVAMATGDVVGWLNADDLYRPGALHRVATAFADRPQALWAFGRCGIIGADGAEIRSAVTAYKNFFTRRYSRRLHLTHNFVSSPATFVRRDAFLETGGLDTRFKYSMDYDLWLRLGSRSDPIYIDDELAAFRMQEGTLSMTGFERQFVEHAAIAAEQGGGHRVAVASNALLSRAIVLTYRFLAFARSRRSR